LLLLSCGAGADVPRLEPSPAAHQAAEFLPSVGAPWINDVISRFEADERVRVAGTALAYFRDLPGQVISVPEVTARMLGGMSAANVFSGTIETNVRLQVMYSLTQAEEHVAQALLRDAVGVFTSTADCEREIRWRCATGCGAGEWFDRGRFSDDFSDATYFKPKGRWERCKVRDGVIKTGPKGRAMWCDVFELNDARCQAPASYLEHLGLTHPVATCEYHQATVSVHWVSAYACALERDGWTCQMGHAGGGCTAVALTLGAPPPPHCPTAASVTPRGPSIIGDPTERQLRTLRLAAMLQDGFAP
jgi:hypothetical protein